MRHTMVTVFLIGLAAFIAVPGDSHAQEKIYSPTLMGPIGLNSVPSARMDKVGTVRIGVGTIDPYLHSFAGVQIAEPLYVGIRQSAEKSSLGEKADRLYPGLDLKLRLAEESRYKPEVVIGLNSAFGHKKTASEYIAMSKRINDFDFTLGMGWGRLAGNGHLGNPFKKFSGHFDNDRDFNNEIPGTVHDWFTGDKVGIFAGVEYFTPWEGLSIKADYGANPYDAEKSIDRFSSPAPWSFSLNYSPVSWASGMIGVAGTDTLMARLSLQSQVYDWLVSPYQSDAPPAMRPHRTGHALPDKMQLASQNIGIDLYDVRIDGTSASAYLQLDPNQPATMQIGRAARVMANHAGTKIEDFTITPVSGKMVGAPVTLMRRDLENALIHQRGSPEEIWRDALINEKSPPLKPSNRHEWFDWDFSLALKTDISLSEDDAEYLYRSSFIVRERTQLPYGFFGGTDIRLNIADNLNRLGGLRWADRDPVRSDVDNYTAQRFYLDRAYTGWRGEVIDDVFLSASLGLLEEQFYGVGGEIIFRPFGKTFAVGAEGWQLFKRDPASFLGQGYDETNERFSGHLNLWYEVPATDMTFYAKAGQYLGQDLGVTLGVDHKFQNGVKLGGFVTASKQADLDAFGGVSHLYSGVRLSVPLGNIKYVPEGSEVITTFAAQARDSGQLLDKPEPLYAATEPLSSRHLGRNWSRLLD